MHVYKLHVTDNFANYSNCFPAYRLMEILETDVMILFSFLSSGIINSTCNERCHATKEQASKPFTRGRVLGRSALKLFSAEEGFGLLPMLAS